MPRMAKSPPSFKKPRHSDGAFFMARLLNALVSKRWIAWPSGMGDADKRFCRLVGPICQPGGRDVSPRAQKTACSTAFQQDTSRFATKKRGDIDRRSGPTTCQVELRQIGAPIRQQAACLKA